MNTIDNQHLTTINERSCCSMCAEEFYLDGRLWHKSWIFMFNKSGIYRMMFNNRNFKIIEEDLNALGLSPLIKYE